MALVSVIIPTYKAVDCLVLCVQSLAASSLKEQIEVCIYGDGGGEPARDAIQKCEQILAENGIQCRVFYNPQNLGNTPAVNRAIALAQGEWLFLCNDDMVFPHQWLEISLPLLLKNRILSLSCIEPPAGGHVPSRYFYAENLGVDPRAFNIEDVNAFNAKILHRATELEVGVNYPFFVERELFYRVGAADERFSGPYHDPDLFLRFRIHGFEMVRTQRCALYHFSGVSLRFENGQTQNQKKKKSLRWVHQENEGRLQFIRKWGAKPRSRFGEIPKTRANAPFDWTKAGVFQKAALRTLIVWEQLRGRLRELNHS